MSADERRARALPEALVVMGVAGCGKTTVAEHLAEQLHRPFAEADDFHTAAAKAKMASGHPLTDADRWPWLDSLRDWIDEQADADRDSVVTCSALKRSYRDLLRTARARVRFVHLTAPEAVLAQRIGDRRGHFMPAAMLRSQLDDLEPLAADEDGVTVDVSGSPQDSLAAALRALDASPDGQRRTTRGTTSEASATAPATASTDGQAPRRRDSGCEPPIAAV